MCKYCDGSETPIITEHPDLHNAEVYIAGNTLVSRCEDKYMMGEISFCPKCGTPLGEVKPLTVEQLKQINGKPVYVVPIGSGGGEKQWCVIFFDVRAGDGHNGALIAGEDMFFYPLYSYLKDWLAFDQEPKGEAE